MPYMTTAQKLQGDPGIFGTLGKLAGGLIGVAGKVLPGPIGTAVTGIGGLLGVGKTQPAGKIPTFAPVMPGGATVTGAGYTGTGFVGPLPKKKRRRMDPLNPKALRRATRRLAAFDREKKKVEKELRKIAPKPARRSPRRDLQPGHTHVR